VFAPDTDAVVYLAQSPRYREGLPALDHLVAVNTLSAAEAATAARAAGVRTFAYFSTGNVYAPSFAPLAEEAPTSASSPYAASKLWGEQVVTLAFGPQALILRPFGLFGPGQRSMLVATIGERVRRGEPVALAPRRGEASDVDGLRTSPCFAPDAARFTVDLLERGASGVFNLAGDEVLSIRALAEGVGRVLSVAPRFVVTEQPRDFDLIADTRKLRALVGPGTTTEAALRETFASPPRTHRPEALA
jgi:nucleoside-diphosphate-sugar epimerase